MQGVLTAHVLKHNTKSGSHEYWNSEDIVVANTAAGLIANKGGLP